MYGTVAYMLAQPGQRDLIWRAMDIADSRIGPLVSGWVYSHLFKLSRSPNEAVMVAVFDDRQSYYRNAESPAQHERYLRIRALLVDDPLWFDGDFDLHTLFKQPPESAKPFGSLRHLLPRPGAGGELDRVLDRQARAMNQLPGFLSSHALTPALDPRRMILITVFESRGAYVAITKSPAQRERDLELRDLLTGEPACDEAEVSIYLRF